MVKKTELKGLTLLKDFCTWDQVRNALQNERGYLCDVYRATNGSTIIDFCDTDLSNNLQKHYKKTLVEYTQPTSLQVMEVDIQRTLWQRIKYVFTG